MSKNRNTNNSPRKSTSNKQKWSIRGDMQKQRGNAQQTESAVGKVYRGETKYIDIETKKQRDYAVVRDNGGKVTVAKLKSIKHLDAQGRNADRALVEINHERYGLPNRTGIDFQRFDKNRMSGKPLELSDKNVFPEATERFTLSNKDRDKALFHTGVRKRRKKKK